MSGTVMKFGPQWIRTLTDGAVPSSASSNPTTTTTTANINNNNSNNINSTSLSATNHTLAGGPSFSSISSNSNGGAAGKYKLAEFRYGREEMLALFEPDMEAPEDIRKFTDLYVKEVRMPMAMTQMSEEEVRLSTRNWNSEMVLRSGKIAASTASGGLGAGSNQASGGSGGAIGLSSGANDRDNRQLSERGVAGSLSAAGVLSSSPRGPPGSLSRIPIEQRGLLSSLNSRGPSTIRNLVGRTPNMSYIRSQSHDDEGADDGTGAFDSRFGLTGQPRQPSSLRTRFETSRNTGAATGSKPIDIKGGTTIEGEVSSERRSVFDKLPNKYSVDDKNVRKDVNGRPIQTSDWRSREWSGSGVDNRGVKASNEERSWRSSRGGAAEDWRSNNSSNTSSSWYVRTDDQRNLRAGVPQNQENLNSGFSGKRDTLRRPSVDDRHDEDDDAQPRHRRDSLPEWSIGDPLSGDKVGSFDATGAFREIAREDGNDSMIKEKNQQEQSGYDIKSTGGNTEQEWRLKTAYSSNPYEMPNTRNINGIDTATSLNELEKLSLLDRTSIPNRNEVEQQQQNVNASNESRTKTSNSRREPQSRDIQNRFIDANFQNSIQNQLSGNKIDLQARTSPPTADNDGFAHIERAAESMVAEFTADNDEDNEPSATSAYFGNKLNLTREQQDAQTNMLQNNTDARLSNQAQQQQSQQSGSEQAGSANSSAFDINNQKKFILLPFNHEDSQQWFYRDTQSVIQGPFSAAEMFEWYRAGYFVKELLVRRACDESFHPLGEVIKLWERIPFAPLPMDVPPPPPITTQTLIQFRAAKQLEMAAGMNPSQSQIPPNAFGITHPGTVLLHGPLIQQQQQQQQVHQVLAAASLNQNISAVPQEQQAGIRQILEATRQHEVSMVQQQQRAAAVAAAASHSGDQNEMQTQLRQLLAQLKNREGFSNLNAQEQQEVLVRQFVASRSMPGIPADQDLLRTRMTPFLPYFNDEERFRYQQRLELERRHKEEAEKQSRFIMEQRMKAEEEKQRIMDELQKRQRKQKEDSEKQRQEAEKDRLLKLSQLKQQQLAKQQEEFRQQMQNQQRLQQQQQPQQQPQQQEKKQQVIPLNSIQQQQQQQIERAKKAAQAQQVQQEQQRKTAWSTVSKTDQEPISLATLQKMQEEEKEKERERQRQIQQQIQSNQQQQQQLQQQLQRQMTWANAAQQSKPAPVKTLAEIQKEEEERLAREKQKKTKVQHIVPNAGVWNNAASHLSWKNPPADS